MPFFESLSRVPLYQRILVIAVIVLLLGVGFYFLIFSPKAGEIKKLETQNAGLQAELTTLRVLATKLEVLKKLNSQLSEQLVLAEAKLPRDKEVPTLLATISVLGDRNGLAFETFSPGAMTKKGFYAEVPLTFRVKGPYHRIVTFFDEIARLPRIVGFKDVKMGTPTTKGNYTIITANCQALTYVFLSQGEE
jgi:type IV pilus assembly protein PilO